MKNYPKAFYSSLEYLKNAGMVRAYGRDRGEKNVTAKVYPSLAAMPVEHLEEYFYLFTSKGWYWFAGQNKGGLKLLTAEHCVEPKR